MTLLPVMIVLMELYCMYPRLLAGWNALAGMTGREERARGWDAGGAVPPGW